VNITYGTPLGAAQLDATANVSGAFTYTPATGCVLSVGNNQTLSVYFTPTDSADYTNASATATINVAQHATDTTLVADTSAADWEADRQALLDHTQSLAGLLNRRGLVLRSDLLRPWARWITPEVEPRRYDTRFFAAALPPGQRTRHVGGEADEVAWWPPEAAIQAARDGTLRLFPPTAVCLAQLAASGGLAAALAAPRDLTPVTPAVAASGGEFWLILPPGVEYPL